MVLPSCHHHNFKSLGNWGKKHGTDEILHRQVPVPRYGAWILPLERVPVPRYCAQVFVQAPLKCYIYIGARAQAANPNTKAPSRLGAQVGCLGMGTIVNIALVVPVQKLEHGTLVRALSPKVVFRHRTRVRALVCTRFHQCHAFYSCFPVIWSCGVDKMTTPQQIETKLMAPWCLNNIPFSARAQCPGMGTKSGQSPSLDVALDFNLYQTCSFIFYRHFSLDLMCPQLVQYMLEYMTS